MKGDFQLLPASDWDMEFDSEWPAAATENEALI
jgi:hypothetical protein